MTTELLLWLFVKHFICDFPLQSTLWMYKNKGRYGHPGGVTHALIHAAGTALVFTVVIIMSHKSPEYAKDVAAQAALIDYILHYHIDWAKVNITSYFGMLPTGPTRFKGEMFWILVGLDQLAHALTYFGLVEYLL